MHFSAWKNRLKSVKPEHQVEIYQTLSLLRLEQDHIIFQDRMSKFVQYWMPLETDFIKYISINYANRPGMLFSLKY